ncbi:hypothetical protein BTW08_15260 [Salinicola sp. MH3R3-1]|nr:hypothetical protein BTW08_15260 [Salinicola sp. MH3R3-1]
MGGFVATLRGQRCTAADHRNAALDLARRVYGERVNVRADYLRPSDVTAGVRHRYHVTHQGSRA